MLSSNNGLPTQYTLIKNRLPQEVCFFNRHLAKLLLTALKMQKNTFAKSLLNNLTFDNYKPLFTSVL